MALPEGDYSVKGFSGRDGELFGIAIERKALGDLLSCITTGRARFEKELRRLRCYQVSAVIIEAGLYHVQQGRYRRNVNPNSVLASLAGWEVRYGVPFHFCGDRAGGERICRELLWQYARTVARGYWSMRPVEGLKRPRRRRAAAVPNGLN